MYIVFKDSFHNQAEREQAYYLCEQCAHISSILLEIIVLCEDILQKDATITTLNLKLATRLVYGEDIRDKLPAINPDAYIRSVVHLAYFNIRYAPARRHLDAFVFPAQHLSPKGPFYGYDTRTMPSPNGVDLPSTKELMIHVSWTATAIIALRTGLYVGNKSECAQLYQEHIYDEWTDLVEGVYEKCRNQWGYFIPESEEERLYLSKLCQRALEFKNHYLQIYKDYLLQELQSDNSDNQLAAIQRLGEIIYPDPTVIKALGRFEQHKAPKLQQAAQETTRKVRAHLLYII